MKVLFLDFDGVLNTVEKWLVSQEEYLRRLQDQGGEEPLNFLRLTLEPDKVALLNDLLASTGAVVVLSTSWRNWPDQEYVYGKLQEAGFKGVIIGATPRHLGPGKTRGDEVEAWLKEHGSDVESYAIADDCDDFFGLHDHLVLTNPMRGMTRADMLRLAALLCSETPMTVRGNEAGA